MKRKGSKTHVVLNFVELFLTIFVQIFFRRKLTRAFVRVFSKEMYHLNPCSYTTKMLFHYVTCAIRIKIFLRNSFAHFSKAWNQVHGYHRL